MSKSMLELNCADKGQVPGPGRPVDELIMCIWRRGICQASVAGALRGSRDVGRAEERGKRRGKRIGSMVVVEGM